MRYNRFTVIDQIIGERGGITFLLKCGCGTVKKYPKYTIVKNEVKSCGCLNLDKARERVTTHGMTGTPTYNSWRAMRERCLNKNVKYYWNYGGRGIKLCDRWKNSFESFLMDMGKRPQNTSLDRIDSEGHYEPKNCRWATRKEQNRNSRQNHLVTFNSKTQPLSAWAEELGLPRNRLSDRLRKLHWPVERAFSTDPQVCKRQTYSRPVSRI